MKKNMDVLAQKKRELNTYIAQYNSAVSLITSTIDSLGVVGEHMAEKISEIESYQRELDNTKTSLIFAKEKNDRVMENFKRLVGEA